MFHHPVKHGKDLAQSEPASSAVHPRGDIKASLKRKAFAALTYEELLAEDIKYAKFRSDRSSKKRGTEDIAIGECSPVRKRMALGPILAARFPQLCVAAPHPVLVPVPLPAPVPL